MADSDGSFFVVGGAFAAPPDATMGLRFKTRWTTVRERVVFEVQTTGLGFVAAGSLAKNGGTPGKAPVGYINVRQIVNGTEGRTVEVDPVRGSLMTWAFDAYATGDWTIRRLLAELTAKGLTTVPGPKRPSRPLTTSHLHRLLRHPYYTGVVRYRGAIYEGKHSRLVELETWQRVQDLLTAKYLTGERHRERPHYLKGSIFAASAAPG